VSLTPPSSCPFSLLNAHDLSHDIYKWQSEQRKNAARPRAISFSGGTPTPQDPAFEHIHEPGGFRRNYLLLRAYELSPEAAPPPILNNFIDFLFLFGHFVRPAHLESMFSSVLNVFTPRRVRIWKRMRRREREQVSFSKSRPPLSVRFCLKPMSDNPCLSAVPVPVHAADEIP
jgi:hypothetical protein